VLQDRDGDVRSGKSVSGEKIDGSIGALRKEASGKEPTGGAEAGRRAFTERR